MSDWYYAVDNEQKGPINESELKANFATNKLPTDTLVWKEGMENWAPANQVQAFSFRPPPSPAKVQPPATSSAATTPAAAPATSAPAAAKTDSTKTDSTKPVDLSNIVGEPEALAVDPDDAEKNKIFGILAYLGILFVVPLIAAKNSPYAKYHANQGLTLFIFGIAAFVVVQVIDSIFFMIGLSGLSFIVGLLYLVPIGLIIYGIINAAAGKCVPLPLIGGIKLIK